MIHIVTQQPEIKRVNDVKHDSAVNRHQSLKIDGDNFDQVKKSQTTYISSLFRGYYLGNVGQLCELWWREPIPDSFTSSHSAIIYLRQEKKALSNHQVRMHSPRKEETRHKKK